MLELTDNQLLIGVDGGASEVKAHQVLVLSSEAPLTLGLGPASASCCYDRVRGFEPVPVARQLVDFERGRVRPRTGEKEQARLWIEAAARSILAVASEAERTSARIGMCMPGLKTKSARGISVMRSGPRIPEFLDQLEQHLGQGGLVLAQPIAGLISDGDACGLGEEHDAHGSLRDVANAYYIGGGTGLCEALKIEGELVSFDAVREVLKKAWQMESSQGGSFEEIASMGGINKRYAELSHGPLPVGEEEFPEQRALQGDVLADDVVRLAADALGELVFLRISALHEGGKSATSGSLIRPKTLLDRVVFGQRLARIFGEASLRDVFRERVERSLAKRILDAQDLALRAHYLDGESLKPGFVCASTLRSAPAIGAAAAALETVQQKKPARRGSQEARG